ncbi:hypothetical protein K0504_02590 [Neiella marina]|uniref:Pyrrolidone-carboxylate peptidase n=1 Tax=Neiella holothuriorum TaxID=2870530 RepID=A0ABS7EDL9_9GAMM|nr:hypothetical protein [Neiella holothuriorum]MBW8189911.1 hypothetical protein [Neiella holothuriorum]
MIKSWATGLTLCMSSLLLSTSALADVEEGRVDRAVAAMPTVLAPFSAQLSQIKAGISDEELIQIAAAGWEIGKQVALQQADDRPLYWFRLAAKQKIRQLPLAEPDKNVLLDQFEQVSRGIEQVQISDVGKRVLLTGFDPFFLDRNIAQSNPSGLAALQLDGKQLVTPNGVLHIETVLIPVRFADFDQGMIETLVQPYLQQRRIDMLVTVSMGRKDFDLERFPGKRRSAKAPDNLNVFTGASNDTPLLPPLHHGAMVGPEFVEFSLPVAAMQQAQGPYQINDNREVETLSGTFDASSLAQLSEHVAVQGGGGGYLSNEISYRTVRMRDLFNANIAVGHIHTPRIAGYDKQQEQAIVDQITAMLEKAATEL